MYPPLSNARKGGKKKCGVRWTPRSGEEGTCVFIICIFMLKYVYMYKYVYMRILLYIFYICVYCIFCMAICKLQIEAPMYAMCHFFF